jgi:hypothetical protein
LSNEISRSKSGSSRQIEAPFLIGSAANTPTPSIALWAI